MHSSICAVSAGRPEPGIGTDEVDAKRPRSQGAQSFSHDRQAAWPDPGMLRDPQTARIGDRRGKTLVRDEPHTRADERIPEAISRVNRVGRAAISLGMSSPSDILRFGVYSSIVRIGVLSTEC